MVERTIWAITSLLLAMRPHFWSYLSLYLSAVPLIWAAHYFQDHPALFCGDLFMRDMIGDRLPSVIADRWIVDDTWLALQSRSRVVHESIRRGHRAPSYRNSPDQIRNCLSGVHCRGCSNRLCIHFKPTTIGIEAYVILLEAGAQPSPCQLIHRKLCRNCCWEFDAPLGAATVGAAGSLAPSVLEGNDRTRSAFSLAGNRSILQHVVHLPSFAA